MVKNVFLVGIGYIAAVLLTSTIVVVMHFLLFSTVKHGDIFETIFFGSGYTALFALPGFLATLLFAFKRQVSSSYVFAICGISTAILAHLLAAAVGINFPFQIKLYSAIAGIFGGLIFWLIAGKSVFVNKDVIH